MKYFHIIIFLTFFNFKTNKDKMVTMRKKVDNLQYLQYGETKFTSNMLEATYLFNNSFKDNYKVDSTTIIYKNLKSSINFYNLYHYSYIKTEDKFKTMLLFYFTDYVKSIILVTVDNKKIVDILDITYSTGHVEGEGFEYYNKESNYNTVKKEFISDFNERYISINCPIDTITYYKKGKTKITINDIDKIHEDTIEIK